MKPLISIISECHSENLGDQAIVRSISEILLPHYRVSKTSFGRIKSNTSYIVGATGVTVRHLKAFWLFRAIPSIVKARIRWHILNQKSKFGRHFEAGIEGSDLVVIGGGQLIKNNIDLFCEKLALVSKHSASRSIPFAFVGVGVDRKMSEKNWRTISSTINGASFIALRDEISRERLAAVFKDVGEISVLPDLAFSLKNPHRYRKVANREIDLAVNVMDLESMFKSVNFFGQRDMEKLVTTFCDVVFAARANMRSVTLFTTGAACDLGAANEVRSRVQSKIGIDLPVFHPQTLDELLFFLATVKGVCASRMHAGILAHISGCNTLCINWDDKVKGVWSAVGQSERVIQMDDITSQDPGGKIVERLLKLNPVSDDCLDELAEEVRRGVLDRVEKALMHQQASGSSNP